VPSEVEQEVHAEPAQVVQDLEALSAGAAGVVVEDELVHGVGQRGEVPAAPADLFKFLRRQWFAPQSVAVGRTECLDFLARGFPVGGAQRAEAAFDAVGVVAPGSSHVTTGVPVWMKRPATTISSPFRGAGVPGRAGCDNRRPAP